MQPINFDMVFLTYATTAFSLNRPADNGLKSMLLGHIVNDLNYYVKRLPGDNISILAGYKAIIIYNPSFDETFVNRDLMAPFFSEVFYEELLDLD